LQRQLPDRECYLITTTNIKVGWLSR